MNSHVDYLKSEIDKIAEKSKAEWWNNYLRNTIRFIGVGIPDIRNILNRWYPTIDDEAALILIADKLIHLKIAEYKLAGILIYQNFLLGNISDHRILKHMDILFGKEYIYDWNTCDWFCVRVLTPLVDTQNDQTISEILRWNDKKYLWQARASIVPFALAKSLPNHLGKLEGPMATLIKRKERFAKTAVGWIAREIFKFNPVFVKQFLSKNTDDLTKEVLNNSLKYMEKEKRNQFIRTLRN